MIKLLANRGKNCSLSGVAKVFSENRIVFSASIQWNGSGSIPEPSVANILEAQKTFQKWPISELRFKNVKYIEALADGKNLKRWQIEYLSVNCVTYVSNEGVSSPVHHN